MGDVESLNSSDGAALAGEENHSSNSDMVHLECEEDEMMEEAENLRAEAPEEHRVREDEEMHTSVLQGFGQESEEEQGLQAQDVGELLVLAEELPVETQIRKVVPTKVLMPIPIVKLAPPSDTSTPLPSSTTSETEEPYSIQGLHPPPILTQMTSDSQTLRQPTVSQAHSVKESEMSPQKTGPKMLSSSEMMCGGAVLVAVLGVVAYGAMTYCRK
ncbi:uncharacterized protein si:ch211-214j24.14 [Thalassophryne amazonica]|uniref:uncharacterized protein si:ch211-214j24.14 n=1 Tax=Thalassophryne amazonica TaxID=390379 RepID=UPI001471C507|nr:uncharacterized protein si:ch211-214j24.14 [Thalassophryne amazonica]